MLSGFGTVVASPTFSRHFGDAQQLLGSLMQQPQQAMLPGAQAQQQATAISGNPDPLPVVVPTSDTGVPLDPSEVAAQQLTAMNAAQTAQQRTAAIANLNSSLTAAGQVSGQPPSSAPSPAAPLPPPMSVTAPPPQITVVLPGPPTNPRWPMIALGLVVTVFAIRGLIK
jgi:hypothetical protein